jgi:hypothetical protein
MNWLPQIDYRFSTFMCAACIVLFALAVLANDLFGVLVCGMSAFTNFASAVFTYSTKDLIGTERRQTLIRLTVGE